MSKLKVQIKPKVQKTRIFLKFIHLSLIWHLHFEICHLRFLKGGFYEEAFGWNPDGKRE